MVSEPIAKSTRGSIEVSRTRARPDLPDLAFGVEDGEHGMGPSARAAGDAGAIEPAPDRLPSTAGDLGRAQATQSLEPHVRARPV